MHDDVYIRLKKKYPDLSVGVSVFCVPFFPEWSPGDDIVSQLSGLTDLENTSDFIAFSVHPFMSSLTAESFPEDYLKTLFAMTDKPVAVSESSYPAQNWKTITEPIIEFNGTQHYEPNTYFGGQKGFEFTRKNDKIKQKY